MPQSEQKLEKYQLTNAASDAPNPAHEMQNHYQKCSASKVKKMSKQTHFALTITATSLYHEFSAASARLRPHFEECSKGSYLN